MPIDGLQAWQSTRIAARGWIYRPMVATAAAHASQRSFAVDSVMRRDLPRSLDCGVRLHEVP